MLVTKWSENIGGISSESKKQCKVRLTKGDILESGAVRRAFTLAEVLITLGIIGVVAALTIPTLITGYKNKELETRYKKAKAILANGIKLLMAKEEVYEVSNLQISKCGEDKSCYASELQKVFKIAMDNTSQDLMLPEKYMIQDKPAVSFVPSAYAAEESPFSWDDVPYIFQTQDGTTYGVEYDADNKWLNVYADVNGAVEPNTTGKDMFKFAASGTGVISDMTSDLEQVAECSLENLAGCNTYEKCNAVSLARCENGFPVKYPLNACENGSGDYGCGLNFEDGVCNKTTKFGSYCR